MKHKKVVEIDKQKDSLPRFIVALHFGTIASNNVRQYHGKKQLADKSYNKRIQKKERFSYAAPSILK
jgi:hypothetical protein